MSIHVLILNSMLFGVRAPPFGTCSIENTKHMKDLLLIISPISRHIDALHCMVLHDKRHLLHFTGSSKTKFQMDMWLSFQFGEWCLYSSQEKKLVDSLLLINSFS